MWGNCNKISSDMDLTGAPYTSAPTQGVAPTNTDPVADGWFPIARPLTVVLGNRRVMDDLYLLVYSDATDVDLTPWFYCPDFVPEGSPAVGKHISGTLLEDVPATGAETAVQGSIFRIPVPPMATHVRIERGTQTGGTYCKGGLYSAEEIG